MKIVPINKVKANPQNPRIIRDDKFIKLMKSIEDFPDMINKRPLIVFTDKDGKFVVLGGNMRLKAMKELKIENVPVIIADDWTEEQKAEFLIKDNLNFGEWNWDEINQNWDDQQLNDWGMDIWKNPTEIDYSIMDEENLDDELNEKTKNVKKAIQIEFESEHYEEAFQIVKFWREREAYIGGMILEFLKSEKEKI